MIEPSLDFQTVIRTALISSPLVTELVAPAAIRSGGSRPDRFPCIRLSDASTEYLGRASGGQLCARVSVDFHIWAVDDGSDSAKALGHKAVAALLGLDDQQETFLIVELDFPRCVWLPDVRSETSFQHGLIQIEGVIQWPE